MTQIKNELVLDKLAEANALKELAEQLIKMARAKGATAAEVALSTQLGFSVTARMGAVETVEYHRDKGVGVTVYFEGKKGTASSSDVTAKALQATVEAACDIAKCTGVDPYSGLAEHSELAWDYQDLDLFHPWDIDPERAIELAKACEDYGRAYDKRIVNSDGASVATGQNIQVYGNSHGFIGCVPTTIHSLSCMLVAKEHSAMQRDYYYTSSRDPRELLPEKNVGLIAAKRTIERLNARKAQTSTVPVLFEPEIAKSLIRTFISAISGGVLYRKSSFLLDKINKPVFAKHIHLYERPHIPRSLGSAPYDGDGVRTRDKDFVRDGILQNYVLGSYSARKLGMPTTGNAGGVCNLKIEHSDLAFEALIKKMNRGLVVRELLGQGINLVTGDYSRGASGFWVENGEIQYPVEEITIAGNLSDMFQQVVAVGNDVDTRGNIHSGSILIEGMMVSGS